jgi:3-deoxy-manno-octulosonate cytidylyltransferase (CMP-KDO synthetase)
VSTDFWVVIPARRASTRLPNKPLADIHGRPMIVRVAEQAAKSGAAKVVVATDDQEIVSVVTTHGFEAVLTRTDHPSGTDRIAEVCQRMAARSDQLIVNVQGDEPMMDPQLVAAVARRLATDDRASVSTAAAPITDEDSLRSPHVVKVVCNELGHALYFSRAPIPYHRDQWPTLESLSLPPAHTQAMALMRHLGIYGFRAGALSEFVSWPSAPIERLEQLEQLRWLWKGRLIAVHKAAASPHGGVDTPEDLARVRALWTEHQRV